MKLYIIDGGLWHLCPNRNRIDSLFKKTTEGYYCKICNQTIPYILALPFKEYIGSIDSMFPHSLAKTGHQKDYFPKDLNELKYEEIEI